MVAWLSLIVATGAYLLSLPSSTWNRRARATTALAVIGTSAALTWIGLFCFGYLPGCIVQLTRVAK